MIKISILYLISFFILYANCSRPLGVSLERASLYDNLKPFACLDGSAVVPFDRVNDDYCDCRDGSDEPGTSACINGIFTCENSGYVEQAIPSSRVNDGICDCCDGSDEQGKCKNTCDALAVQAREEQQKAKQLLESGILKKKELLEKGAQIRQALEAKVKELDAVKANVENDKVRLEVVKSDAEAKAKEATDAQDKVFEEEAKLLAALEIKHKSNDLFVKLDTDKDGILSPQELVSHNELDVLFDNDGEFTLDEANRFLDSRDDVSMSVFYENYYDKISSLIVFKNEQTEQEQQTPKPVDQTTTDAPTEEYQDDQNSETEHHDDEHHDEEHYDGNENTQDDHHDEHGHDHGEHADRNTQDSSKPKYNEETLALIEKSNKAKNLLRETEDKLRRVENELSSSKRKLEFDTGRNHEFTSLIDECFEMDDREYTYKLCPFDRTVQKSKSGHGETSIGVWSSWDEGSNYKVMKFENGLSCWNGPARSTKVILSCGSENKVTSVAEPNRCEYEMKFETPCACNESDLENLTNVSDHDEL